MNNITTLKFCELYLITQQIPHIYGIIYPSTGPQYNSRHTFLISKAPPLMVVELAGLPSRLDPHLFLEVHLIFDDFLIRKLMTNSCLLVKWFIL